MRRPRKERPSRPEIAAGKYDPDFLLGSYRSLHVAHSTRSEVRDRAASGGVTTELLVNLLEEGEIGGVIAAGFDEAAPVTPRYIFKTDARGIRTLSGSVYRFMELAELQEALAAVGPAPVAVVVQPCHVRAARRWQETRFPNIRLIVSFFCGYNMTGEAITYLLAKSGTTRDRTERILFRGGPYPGGFLVLRTDGSSVSFGKECYELANLMFLRDGCSRCSLYMGEEADIAMGDAWIREHPRNTAVICRTPAGEKALNLAVLNGRVSLFVLQEKTLMQMHYHNIIYKKYGHSLPMRMLMALFRDILPQAWIPFSLLTRLAYYRRKLKIGISLPILEEESRKAINTPGRTA